MSLDHRCEQCSQPLALADLACSACGHPVPAEARLLRLQERADGLAEAGQYQEAARALEGALQSGPPAEAAKLLWRKRGVWLLRAKRPELLDAAEAALAESLRLDDADEMSHQLWIDLLGRRGFLEKGRGWYEQRLQGRPDDLVAQKQLKLIKLAEDFKSAPLPKLDLPPEHGNGYFFRLLTPTPYKMAVAFIGLLMSLYLLIQTLNVPSVPGLEAEGIETYGSIVRMVNDPWLNGAQSLACAAYLVWAWSRRRG